jgi:hypothetical protein
MIFILKRNRTLFFTIAFCIGFLVLLFSGILLNTLDLLSKILLFLSVLIYFLTFEKSLSTPKNYISHFIFLLLFLTFLPKNINLHFTIGVFISSIIYYLFLNEEQISDLVYLNIGLLLLIGNYFDFSSIGITLGLIIYTLLYSKSITKKFFQLFFGYFLGLISLIQVLYLINQDEKILTYFCDFGLIIKKFNNLDYFLLPLSISLTLSFVNIFQHINVLSFLKKYELNRFYFLIFSVIIAWLFLNISTNSTLIYAIFPISVLIGRFLNFQKKWYIQEGILLILVISSLLYYFKS